MNYSTEVKKKLLSIIKEMDSYRWLFTKNPKTDFSRKKKWSFEEVMKFIINTNINFKLLHVNLSHCKIKI